MLNINISEAAMVQAIYLKVGNKLSVWDYKGIHMVYQTLYQVYNSIKPKINIKYMSDLGKLINSLFW